MHFGLLYLFNFMNRVVYNEIRFSQCVIFVNGNENENGVTDSLTKTKTKTKNKNKSKRK